MPSSHKRKRWNSRRTLCVLAKRTLEKKRWVRRLSNTSDGSGLHKAFDENVSRNDQTGKKRWFEIFDNVGFQNKKVTKQNKKR